MIQSVLLFLVLVVVLGMGGKLLRWMRLPEKRDGGRRVEQAGRCPVCRNFVVGARPAPCDRADCPHRN